MRNRALPLALCILAAACTSSPRPKDVTKADVDVRLTNSLFFNSAGIAAANLEVTVSNTAEMPIVLREVRVTSPGMVTYTLRADSRLMNETIDPGESKTFLVTATVYAGSSSLIYNEPLAVRVYIDFQANGQRHHDYFNILNVTT